MVSILSFKNSIAMNNKMQKETLSPGGIRTRDIFWFGGGRDDHYATPPGEYKTFYYNFCCS
jgi:hypothetical protein